MPPIRYQLLGFSLGGRYRLNRVLAEGKWSVTYEADDAVLRRVVALKVPVVARGNTLWMRERVLRAAAVAAQLPTHQNLVPVLDGGTDCSLDTDFVVMERLYGSTLAALAAARGPWAPFSVAETVAIGAGIVTGLSAAHARSVAHGALTAHDVFLDQRTSPTTVRLLNVARRIGEPAEPQVCHAPPAAAEDLALTDFQAAAALLGELLAAPRATSVTGAEEEVTALLSKAASRMAAGECAPRHFADALGGALTLLHRTATPARERVAVPSVFNARYPEAATAEK